MREPTPISASLDAVVSALRGPDRRAVGGVFGRWAEAVGPQIADHVQPVKLDGGVLLVEVDEPGWATEVRFLAPTIIERLATVAGVRVQRIEARVDRRNARGSRST